VQDDDAELEVTKGQRKRAATAAQKLGERLIALNADELDALELPEPLRDAVDLAKRITSHGGLARQRQYIGKLMRSIDTTSIEARLNAKARDAAFSAERHRRTEAWRERLVREGTSALDQLCRLLPQAPRARLDGLLDRATNLRTPESERSRASRELFRVLRGLFDSGPGR
jgi:ribosome-associated protein